MLALREDGAREALSTLCEIYWTPVYAFIRRSGRPVEDARDLTQAFFTAVIDKGHFAKARQERGRFRSFLLSAVRNFLSNEYDLSRTQMRGGGRVHLTLDFDDGEQRYARQPADTLTPEEVFARQWAADALDAALDRLDARHRAGWMKDSRFYDPLRRFVLDEPDESYATLAARLSSSEGSLRVMLHRMRQQFQVALREVVADTVQDDDAVDAELREMLAIVSRGRLER
ncbi:MAG: hypothetical protein A3H96_00990 [Acidobacteria bacterium RIFCSPLOWO2_02_FULL_67_36]|nr:MAG: hypothetical protein A3H96_00990 [Acidobacteria bacterium RIFCSPLOWO2_02_FULL_67_36]OFW23143.1 MAG: hypothetical protein A3G21_00360 [Acidobacteria bacterium RIFCSPLOWO2_12_FULL_66_21]